MYLRQRFKIIFNIVEKQKKQNVNKVKPVLHRK